jgi:phage terminase large subunit-like protein
MNVSRRPFPSDVRLALRESESYLVVMAPSHMSAHDPVRFRDAQFDLVWNVDRIKNDDPRALVGNIVYQAGHRRAAVVKKDSAAKGAPLTQ